jgi:GH24 family phage-related lysozyme (muramidase)
MKFAQKTLSTQGFLLTSHQEGLRLLSYQDTGGVWTNGIGHTGKDVTPNQKVTMQQAMNWFAQDSSNVIAQLNNLQEQTPNGFNQNQFDALFDLIYNAGIGHFLNVAKYPLWNFIKVNPEDSENISDNWLDFCIHDASGQISKVLQNRREIELALYFLA